MTSTAEFEPIDRPEPNPRKPRPRWWVWLRRLVLFGLVIGVIGFIAVCIYVFSITRDLPSVKELGEYKPAVMTRVHAGDGKLIAEYSREARVFVPIESIPTDLQHAFVATEDQRFYRHGGWDPIGLVRATLFGIDDALTGGRVGGTSTITQQVAKNFLVGDDYSIRRKIREIAIARRIEAALDKDHILELYLNEIYFGRRSYGVAAASLNYFGKPMDELDVSEMAYLALLPKGPNNYRLDDPDKLKRAKIRRNYVLGRMVEDGYITEAVAQTAKGKELVGVERLSGQEYLAAEYFVEDVRKQLFEIYGEDELYEGGLSVRTTLDTSMQLAARKALRAGLEAYDLRHGYRGPLATIAVRDWKDALPKVDVPRDLGDWVSAVVLDANADTATIGYLEEGTDAAGLPVTDARQGRIALKDMDWAAKALRNGRYGTKPTKVTDVLAEGDVVLAKPLGDDRFALRQVPAVNGALMAMDPHTGRVLALVGGYSFQQSQFNRASQAYRQPGSSFKPFVYAAAMENGYTPASRVLDAPFVIEMDADCMDPDLRPAALRRGVCGELYKPSNFTEDFFGLSTLRFGLEKSKNAMTVRLANDIGMETVGEIGERFGIYDRVPAELAWSLGAGETTMFRLANAYSIMINGGKRIAPTLLDRVQNGRGETIYRHPDECTECYQEEWRGQSPPDLPDEREQVIDPVTAYQSTFMMQGVVENGSGRSIAVLERPLGGKTGTTNDYKDGWFMGFSPDLVAGVYVGFDTPQTMGRESGGVVAAPIFRDFMGEVLADEPIVPFRIPEGVSLSPIDRKTGEPSFIGAENFILEAFKPGTEPRLGASGPNIGIGTGGTEIYGGFGDDFGFDVAGPEGEAQSDFETIDGETVEPDSAETPRPQAPTLRGTDAVGGEAPSPNTRRADVQAALTPAPRPQDRTRDADPSGSAGPAPTGPSITESVTPQPEVEEPLENIDDGLY